MTKRIVAGLLVVVLFPAGALADSLGRIRSGLARPMLIPSIDVAAASLVQASSCDTSTAAGRNDANTRHGTAGWFLGGVGAGVGLTFIGTGIITGASALTNPQPRTVPSEMQEPCYREGYRSRAKRRNLVSSLLGGLVGTGAWLAIYYARNN